MFIELSVKEYYLLQSMLQIPFISIQLFTALNLLVVIEINILKKLNK